MVPKNSTVANTIDQTTTVAVQPSSPSQTDMNTSPIFNKSSSYLEMTLTSSKHFSATLDNTSLTFLQNSSVLDVASSSFLILGSKTAEASFATQESISVPKMQTSTLSLTQTTLPTSMYHTSVSIAITQASRSKSSINLQTEMMSISHQFSTTQMSMFQLNTTREFLPSRTEMVHSTTVESSVISKSSNIVKLVASKSSSVLLQQTSWTIINTSSNKKHISSIQPMVTTPIPSTSMIYKSSTPRTKTIQIFPTSAILPQSASTSMMYKPSTHRTRTTQILSTSAIVPQSSSLIAIVSNISASQNSDHTANTIPIPSSDKTIFYSEKSKTQSFNAMKRSSIVKITSVVTTSFVMVTSSHKASTETSKLPTSSHRKIISSTLKLPASSHLKTSSQSSSLVTTSSQFPNNRQTPSFATESLHHLVSSSAEKRKYSTNSRNRQSTNILQSSLIPISTADGLHSTTTAPVQPSSHHLASSFSQEQGK